MATQPLYEGIIIQSNIGSYLTYGKHWDENIQMAQIFDWEDLEFLVEVAEEQEWIEKPAQIYFARIENGTLITGTAITISQIDLPLPGERRKWNRVSNWGFFSGVCFGLAVQLSLQPESLWNIIAKIFIVLTLIGVIKGFTLITKNRAEFMKGAKMFNRILFLGLLLLLVTSCQGAVIPGTAVRYGYTTVHPVTSISKETFYLSGPGTGDRWSLIWVEGDEFVYCVEPTTESQKWLELVDDAVRKAQPFVIHYQDGGGATTFGCTPGIKTAHQILVTGISLLNEDTDLSHRMKQKPVSNYRYQDPAYLGSLNAQVNEY